MKNSNALDRLSGRFAGRFWSLVRLSSLALTLALPGLAAAVQLPTILKACQEALSKATSTAGQSVAGPVTPLQRALIRDYTQGPRPESLQQLKHTGLPAEMINKLAQPHLTATLDSLEKAVGTKAINFARNQALLAAPIRTSQEKLTLTSFSKIYKLENARSYLSEVSEIGKLPNVTTARDALLTAMLLQDSRAIRRAINIALRMQLTSEITAVAAASGNEEALLFIGEAAVARYLYFDRNHNYLREGLRALGEVTGPGHVRVQAMLSDLFDLMISSEIVADEPRLRNYGSEGGRVDFYAELATHVLNSAVKTTAKTRRDSSGTDGDFLAVRQKNSDPALRRRADYIVNLVLANKIDVNGKALVPTMAIFYSEAELPQLAERFLKVAKESSEPRRAKRMAQFAMEALFLAGDTSKISPALKRIEAMGIAENDLYFYEDGVPYFSRTMADYLCSLVQGKLDVEKGFHSLKYKIDKLRERQGSDVQIWSGFMADKDLSHHSAAVRAGIAKGSHLNPHQVEKMSAAAQKALDAKDYWNSYYGFLMAKDVAGLRRAYSAMMTDGRGIDAGYAAVAIEILETGTFTGEPLRIEAR